MALQPGVADEIQKLHQLLTSGALTRQEFDKAKADLLAGQTLPPPPAPLPAPPPAPTSTGGAGCVAFLVLAIAVAGIAALMNPKEQAHRDELAKVHPGFKVGAAVGEMIGTAKYRYHNYLVFSTMSVIGIVGVERPLSTGFFGMVSVSTPAAAAAQKKK